VAAEGTVIAPGECKQVYEYLLISAYIGIAILDSRGQWVAGTADNIPDLGTKEQRRTPVLTRGSVFLCYRGDKTRYGIRRPGEFPTDCSGFHPAPDEGSGPYMPLMTIFHFDPDPSRVYSGGGTGPGWVGGDYYLNIAPSASSRDVRATPGMGADASAPSPRPGVVPAAFNTKEKYGVYLYIRMGRVSDTEASSIYAGMVKTLGKDVVEAAAEKVRTAEKKPNDDLVTHVNEPYKVGPDGRKVEDYDAPVPPGVIGVYTNQLVAMEMLATGDSDSHYLLYLLKSQFQTNRRFLPQDADKWTYAKNSYDGLTRAFGQAQVEAAAHVVHTATKRLLTGSIMNQQALGATRNEPFEAFEDILARKDPRRYVRAAIAFKENLYAPASVDVETGYRQLISGSDETKVLAAARTMVAGKPHFLYRDELDQLKKVIDGR
jgi:hypothetical protein